MYHGGSRSTPEEEDRRRKEYYTRSPTHGHPYSPTNGTNPRPHYPQYQPSGPSVLTSNPMRSPRMGEDQSPRMNGAAPSHTLPPPTSTTPSTRYDPLSEHRESNVNQKSIYELQSPTQVRRVPFEVQAALTDVLTESRAFACLRSLCARSTSNARVLQISDRDEI